MISTGCPKQSPAFCSIICETRLRTLPALGLLRHFTVMCFAWCHAKAKTPSERMMRDRISFSCRYQWLSMWARIDFARHWSIAPVLMMVGTGYYPGDPPIKSGARAWSWSWKQSQLCLELGIWIIHREKLIWFDQSELNSVFFAEFITLGH